ncbi:SGNH/GDSL hydrolase family protein [Kitasatospora sp. RB6PN24]|uniref:SGNH/GDSL hydrolase family protein n=1 Tax=Kitasatospora humi TaxID=2893891 RepID=UPI001E592934|nr:SGNH/GDSL hydrolase family protein [Kitasatospora humi]MCC9307835.1 SGNH/GDSL hydrolase family protein [Kitasatospora humi]
MARFLSRLALAGTAGLLTVGLAVPPAQAVPDRTATRPADRSGPLTWTALGDSYSAGVVQATGNEFEAPPDGCARTTGSYPELLRHSLGSAVVLRNVTCSGATIAGVYRSSQVPAGRPMPPLGTDPDAPFAPVPPQIDALSPQTKVITVGIGGNTLGFIDILTSCLELGAVSLGQGTPCEAKFGAGMSGRLQQVSTEYDAMLTALHAKAPHARIVTVGYPHLFPEDASRCHYGDLLEFGTITTGDLAWARTAVLERLNAVIQKVTGAHRDTFVDLYPSTAGHSACDRADGNNWVDGLLSSLVPLRYAYVHPNAKGQAHAAERVKPALLS